MKFKWYYLFAPWESTLDMVMGGIKPDPVEPFEVPDEEIGADIPVIFGTRRVKPKLAWYGGIETKRYKVSTAGKK